MGERVEQLMLAEHLAVIARFSHRYGLRQWLDVLGGWLSRSWYGRSREHRTGDVRLGALSCTEQRRCLVLLVAEQQDEHVPGSFSNVPVVQIAQSLQLRDESDV